jgi:hypothetical protein
MKKQKQKQKNQIAIKVILKKRNIVLTQVDHFTVLFLVLNLFLFLFSFLHNILTIFILRNRKSN